MTRSSAREVDPAIEALVAAFYAAFDNRETTAPSLETLRAIFCDDARITRVAGDTVDSWTLDAFVAPREALLRSGRLVDFHEWETGARTTIDRDIAQRSSTYEKAGVLDGESYGGRGRKFIAFCRAAGRWKIASVLWQDE